MSKINKVKKGEKTLEKENILLQDVCEMLMSHAYMMNELLHELVYHKESKEK